LIWEITDKGYFLLVGGRSMIAIGDKVPRFTLKDQNRKDVFLDRVHGKKVLLSFRPLAWTPVCQDQMMALEANYSRLEALNTIPFGIGVDSSFSNHAWGEKMGIKKLRLLADFWPHGEVARLYGVFREADGFAERANILLDEKQQVIYTKIYPLDQLPDIEEIIGFMH
jgi:peroxiredoxin